MREAKEALEIELAKRCWMVSAQNADEALFEKTRAENSCRRRWLDTDRDVDLTAIEHGNGIVAERLERCPAPSVEVSRPVEVAYGPEGAVVPAASVPESATRLRENRTCRIDGNNAAYALRVIEGAPLIALGFTAAR